MFGRIPPSIVVVVDAHPDPAPSHVQSACEDEPTPEPNGGTHAVATLSMHHEPSAHGTTPSIAHM
jgi:hypothetical protein